jgi:hypothetical protein
MQIYDVIGETSTYCIVHTRNTAHTYYKTSIQPVDFQWVRLTRSFLHLHYVKVKVKVKQFPYRSEQALSVPGG